MIIEKNYLTLQPFEIPLKVLREGSNHFEWSVGKEFFEAFGNEEILAAELQVEATVYNHNYDFEVESKIDGSVTVACDRCLDPLEIPVHTSFTDDELTAEQALDLSQDVYDYVCTALPMIRVHPEDECNQEVTKYLSK